MFLRNVLLEGLLGLVAPRAELAVEQVLPAVAFQMGLQRNLI